jgi:hypothetical protein
MGRYVSVTWHAAWRNEEWIYTSVDACLAFSQSCLQPDNTHACPCARDFQYNSMVHTTKGHFTCFLKYILSFILKFFFSKYILKLFKISFLIVPILFSSCLWSGEFIRLWYYEILNGNYVSQSCPTVIINFKYFRPLWKNDLGCLNSFSLRTLKHKCILQYLIIIIICSRIGMYALCYLVLFCH